MPIEKAAREYIIYAKIHFDVCFKDSEGIMACLEPNSGSMLKR